jgi:hypothetical protein
MPKTTIPPLTELSLKELVALHNQYAERPVQKFRDKPTAIQRTIAVLPKEPEQPSRQSLPDRLLALMRDGNGHHLEVLASALDCTTNQVRGALGSLRHRGWETLNTAPKTFALGEFNDGGPSCAGPRYTQEG